VYHHLVYDMSTLIYFVFSTISHLMIQ